MNNAQDPNTKSDCILILDFGLQHSQLIARRIREIGVYAELHAYDITQEQIREYNPKGIILSGGPNSAYETDAPIVFEMGVPVLSICYGFQTIIKQFGGVVSKGDIKEFGYVKMDVTTKDVLLANLADDSGQTEAWMSHGDKVTKLAEGFTVNIKHAKLFFRFYSSHRQAFFWCAISP